MSLFLLTACIFGTPSDGAASDDSTRAADDGDDTEAAPTGNSVRFKTTDVDVVTGEPVAVDVPRNATFVRVDSCTDNGEDALWCDSWDGGYQLYDNGDLTLTPSTWDGELARVTWLVIE